MRHALLNLCGICTDWQKPRVESRDKITSAFGIKLAIAFIALSASPIAVIVFTLAPTNYQGQHMQYTNQLNQHYNNHRMNQQLQQQQMQINWMQMQQHFNSMPTYKPYGY